MPEPSFQPGGRPPPGHSPHQAPVQVPSDDAFYLDHVHLSDDHPVGPLCPDHVVWDAESLKEVGAESTQQLPLPWHVRGEDDVEGGHPVREVEYKLVIVVFVDVLHLT